MAIIPLILAILGLIPAGVKAVKSIVDAIKAKGRHEQLREAFNAAFDFVEAMVGADLFSPGADAKLEKYLEVVRDTVRAFGLGELSAQELEAAKAWARLRAGASKTPTLDNAMRKTGLSPDQLGLLKKVLTERFG